MEDVLEERRITGDWWWVLRRYTSPRYALGPGPQVARNVKDDVLGSQAVQHAIEQLTEETGRTRDDLESEAALAIDQMGHLFTMKAVRFFGLLLAKIFKRLYTSIDVNVDGLEAVRRVVPRSPILLMPTHRSYVDFLLVAYVFFHYGLPLPVVAAGQDFTSMKVIGRLMRHAGAFFIRRSFGGDRLYWAIFAEYISSQVVNGEAPLEFFVEGTRSRSGKSLFPKHGLLTSALEPYFKAQVPDITVVPVAISYDRTLEETLYVHEMLGIPKPKETTIGLLKAMKILSGNYGSIKIIVGEPISFGEFCGSRLDRSVHSCSPRHLSPNTRIERDLISELAQHVVDRHRELLPIRPFVVIAAAARALISMQTVDHNSSTEVPLLLLALDVRWLINVLERLGSKVDWPLDRDPVDVIRDTCMIHANIVEVTEVNSFRILVSSLPPAPQNDVVTRDVVMNSAVANLCLDHYGNQMLHVVVAEGILALILLFNSTDAPLLKEWVHSEYCFLKKVLQLEFVICEGRSTKDFGRAVSVFTEFDALVEINGCFNVNRDAKIVVFLAALFEPFLLGYRILCQELLAPSTKAVGESHSFMSAKELAKRTQNLVTRTLKSISGLQRHHAALSLELLANCVYALHNMGAVRKGPSTSKGISLYGPVYDTLLPIARRLDLYARFPFSDHNPLPSTNLLAKL